jgi:hypothetical protein
MKIRVMYVPKTARESFYSTQMDKFRILGLTQYSRVLFMDADVMPTANLDYIMEMSLAGKLKENLVIRGRNEPSNGGFFMLQPYVGALKEMNNIIENRRISGNRTGYPFFDPVGGWGHAIVPPDEYESFKGTGKCAPFNDCIGFHSHGIRYSHFFSLCP